MIDRFKFRAWDDTYKRFIFRTLIDSKEASLEWEQCTGLKDKNGRLIYEGDVVKQFNNHGRLLRVGYIVYNEKEMKYKIREERCPDWNEKTDDFAFHPLKQRLLVIGNIHENGNLL